MHIHNLYEDENGVSHWRDVEIEWTTTTPTGRLAALEILQHLVDQPVLGGGLHDDARHFGQSHLNRGGPASVAVHHPEAAVFTGDAQRLQDAVLADALGETIEVVRDVTPHVLRIRLNSARIDQH